MSNLHLAYLNLGSNILPEKNLPKALELLADHGEIRQISSVWESEAVGTTGPNYLNVCLDFKTNYSHGSLKRKIIHSIESKLGRVRGADKFAPRTLDIDIVLFDGEFIDPKNLKLAYIMVPLAEILPGFEIPGTSETVGEIATRLRREVWLEARQGILG